jgi:hypothetical protein
MSENKTELKRSLGLIDATSLVAGSMIDLEFLHQQWLGILVCCLVIGHLGSDRINYSRCSPQLRRIGWNDA